MTHEMISPDLAAVLKRLRLSRMLDTLPERLALARAGQTPYQDFLLLVLSDEVSRRDNEAAASRADRGHLDPSMELQAWDATAKVTFDKMLLNDLVSLRFVETCAHVAIVGPVGVGKTFVAHALGHAACRRGFSVLAVRADRMLKTLKHSRLDNTYEPELRRLLAVDLLIVDDFALDAMDATESRDAYEILTERHRAGSMIVTSNRGPDEWLTAFADPMRAQSAIDRFVGNSYDLVIEGESYRRRQKPALATDTHRLRTAAPSSSIPARPKAPASTPASATPDPPVPTAAKSVVADGELRGRKNGGPVLGVLCVHCKSSKIVKGGWRRNTRNHPLQLYHCTDCRRRFSISDRKPRRGGLSAIESGSSTPADIDSQVALASPT